MDTGRKINITVLGRVFQLNAATPDAEQRIRCAADYINDTMEKYARTYSNGTLTDHLIFTALNVCMKNLEYSGEMKSLQSEAERLEREIAGYLENID